MIRRTHFVALPGYQWDTARLAVRNMDALLYFIGGGCAEYQHPRDGAWLPVPVVAGGTLDALSFFKRYPCRPKH
jgi:hypothetical protein